MNDKVTSPLARKLKERRLDQRGLVVWLYGLSGAGKSTLATALEYRLHAEGRVSIRLDGDVIRAGLNRRLGFSMEDRTENIRRVAEVAKLQCGAGLITICSLITPMRAMRDLARRIIGVEDFLEVYLACSFAECAQRDVKGLYAQAKAGNLGEFTGRDSEFEPPLRADLVLDTETDSLASCLDNLCERVLARSPLVK